MKVKKKDGRIEAFNNHKIISAVAKSGHRVQRKLDQSDYDNILFNVEHKLQHYEDIIEVTELHKLVELALDDYDPVIAKSYRDYRNYKTEFSSMLDEVYKEDCAIRYRGDKENSNTDSALIPTKRSLVYNVYNKLMYRKFHMTPEELKACEEGYIYEHDQSARRDTMNCCLLDVKAIMTGGFEMGNMIYNEPHYIDTACDVLSDIMMTQASSQYGGLSIPEIDKLLAPYLEATHLYYKARLERQAKRISRDNVDIDYKELYKEALDCAIRDLEQGIQGFEMKFNSVSSSRGDYPFLTFSFGEDVTNPYSLLVAEAILKVRKGGQGKPGKKTPVVFPKLVFLYVEDYHGEGKPYEYLYDLAIECSSTSMYPDYLSLTGDGYVASIYKKYKKIITPMGCRAWLSPWFKRGGIAPADEMDEPVFIGRFNIGAVSLNLPMIYQKARTENKDFYEVLDYYLELIRGIHKRTYEYLGEQKASINPLAYMYGGFYGGNLGPNDKIKPVLKSATASFGITALNELQRLHNGNSLVEDGEFCLEVMKYINDKVDKFKKEDGRLYAIYGTPAENLCGLQVKQFRSKFGIIKNVSDRTYMSNSFHCHVTENIDATTKQDLESRFWDYFNGGKIQYVKYPVGYNTKAIKSLVRRAMKLGFYEGVNLALSTCNNCGHKEENMDICPICGDYDITKIDRMNGYLSYSRINGDTRLSDHKMDEIRDRVSM